jgi:LacI family transcriptional regulator
MQLYGGINMTEVSKRAGVSLSTVSRVINKKQDVSPQSRAKIQKILDETGYRPNLLVSGIRHGKTYTIGVILSWDLTFDGEIIRGIHDELQKSRYVPAIQILEPNGPPEIELLHRLLDRRVDGLIMRMIEEKELKSYVGEVLLRKIPVVAVDITLDNVEVDFVGNNDELGGILAAEYLLKFGHRRIGALVFPKTYQTSRSRLESFETTVKKNSNATVVSVEDPSFGEDYTFAMKLLNSSQCPTGIFVNNDRLAIGVYAAAEKMGIKIPEDISVIGFGDFVLGQYIKPSLTTIHQQPYEIGRMSAKIMLERLANKASLEDDEFSEEPHNRNDNERKRLFIDVTLTDRQSVAKPRQ